MVLTKRTCSIASTAALLSFALGASEARAQSVEVQASALHPPPAEYQPLGIRTGNLILYPVLFAGLEYDSNIYAEPTNTKSDEILHLSPQLRAEVDHGAWQFRGLGEAYFRRYDKHSSENSTAGIVQGDVTFSPRENETFHAMVGWQRRVEDRGDPEMNPGIGVGPRLDNTYNAQFDVHLTNGGWLIDASAVGTRINYLAREDLFRDHNSYGGQITAGRRIGGLSYGTITAFVEHRTFDAKLDLAGIDRDATTYGARAGLEFLTGGIVEGGASIGVFHFSPADNRIKPYTGLSLAANVTYHPTERTAVILNVSRGNVATYRVGATSRTDTRVNLTIQQELHHDLFASLTGYIRDSKWRGSNLTEKTWLIEGGVRYLIGRHFFIGPIAQYAKRTSNDPSQEFSRTRAMLQLQYAY